MAEIFSGLASMSPSETMKPSSMPLETPKMHFSGLSLIPFAQSFCKGLLEISNEVVSPLGLHYDVVDVGLNGSPDEVSEALSIHCWYVAPAFFKPNGIET